MTFLSTARPSDAAALCVSGALSTYTAASFNCDFGGANWFNFGFASSGFASPLGAADITVTPTLGASLVTWAFTGAFESGTGGSGTYQVSYSGTGFATMFSSAGARLVLPALISGGDASSQIDVAKQAADGLGTPLYGRRCLASASTSRMA